MSAEQALLVVAAAHLGFQLTVSLVVYPALTEVPDVQWSIAHEAHARRISVPVILLYGGFVVVGGWVLLAGPVGLGAAVALAAAALTVAVTALVAAPAHRRLGEGRTAESLRRLLVADWIRTAAALVALGAAILAMPPT